jgi:hypothetical protein
MTENGDVFSFWILGFGHLNLFRISDFELRISQVYFFNSRAWNWGTRSAESLP